MEVIYDLANVKREFKNAVLTLGIFDGVHSGHQKILKEGVGKAKEINGESLVISFHPHPLKILKPHKYPFLLTSLSEKIKLIEKIGIDFFILIKFDYRFSQISPENFGKEILYKKLKIKEIFVGSNYIFGREGSGDTKLLKKLGERYNFKINVVIPVKINDEIVSSTKIRNLIKHGKMRKTTLFLGREFSLTGKVVQGNKRGHFLGYPTANIQSYTELIPLKGVYAVRIRLNEEIYKGVLNIGERPTFSLSGLNIEVYIFDFKENIYGKEIEIAFVERMRDEFFFKTPEALKEQIEKDEILAKKILKF